MWFMIILVSVTALEVLFNRAHCKVILWQQTPSATGPVCLGDNVTIICNTSGINILRWFNPQDPFNNPVIFNSQTSTDITVMLGIFNINLVSSSFTNKSYFLHSRASVTNITQNASLGCADHGAGGNTTTISVIVSDTSSSPNNLTYTVSSISSLTLHWIDVNNTCVIEYVVTVNNTEFTTGSNITFFSVTNLSIGSVYVLTVKSKKNGLPSNLLIVHWKVPHSVTNLMYTQVANSNVLIQWEYTEDKLRPAVSSFLIMHNISSPYNESTLNHSIELSALQYHSIYTVTVLASNILGLGTPAELTVEISTTDKVYSTNVRKVSSQTIVITPSTSVSISSHSKTTGILRQNEFTTDVHLIQSEKSTSFYTLSEMATSGSCPSECTCISASLSAGVTVAITIPITVAVTSLSTILIIYFCCSRSRFKKSQPDKIQEYEISGHISGCSEKTTDTPKMVDNEAYGQIKSVATGVIVYESVH